MADRPGETGPTEADVKAAIRDVQAAFRDAHGDVLRLRDERDEAVRRLSECEQALREAELLLAALALYAPHSSVTVDYFTTAHARACEWLAAHSTLSPAEIRAALTTEPETTE